MLVLVLFLLVAIPLGWFVSEFRNNRALRIILGILAISSTTFCACTVESLLTCFNYNLSYGSATKNLVQTSIVQIEAGQPDRVLKVWRGLNVQYEPTYETPPTKYAELVEAATARMKGDIPIEPRSAWDASPFKKDNWVGHWESDDGFWVVIDGTGPNLAVLRSGYPPTIMRSVTLSDDCRVLTFKEGKQWVHKLTLKNKCEASHEWFDAEKQAIAMTDGMYKLVRPTGKLAAAGKNTVEGDAFR
jgi:hypothetical protein